VARLGSKPVRAVVAIVTVAVVATAATALGGGLSSHSSKTRTVLSPAVASNPSTTPPTVVTTTTTMDSVPTGAPIDVPAGGVGLGSSGPAVAAVKHRLADLRYDPGVLNDRFDYPAYHAVVAFEKLHRLARDGRVTPTVAAAMVTDGLASPMLAGAEPTRMEIDLTRQVLVFWRDGKLSRILPVSSGYGGHYCGTDGSCGVAITPTGSYRATAKILGRHTSTLGELWNPVFFNSGIAVHGEPDVPTTPASHGCVRVPMNVSMWVYDNLAIGTPIYVRDDAHTPVPFNQGGTVGPEQPGGTPPTLPYRTVTTPPATAPRTVATPPTTHAKP
jgi:lipoprotein-anchoring transpeptidase ErfK/SrfK